MRTRHGLALGLTVLALASCASRPGRPAAATAPTTPVSTSTVPASTGGTARSGTTTSTPPPASDGCTNFGQIEKWPIARRVAQLIVAPTLDFDASTIALTAAQGIGGVVLLGPASPPADLAARIRAATKGAPLAPLVMADEEGGEVQRLEGPVASLPSPRDMAATMTPEQVKDLAARAGLQMRQLGVDADLAPVLDVDGGDGPNNVDPDGDRSFSPQPSVAATYGIAFLQGLESSGVLPVIKHFPGLGGSTGNTDYGAASTPSLQTLRGSGLVPFRAAIAVGAPAVMVANASVPGLSSEPASLSASVTTGLLRDSLGFRGLVVTDSLTAGAVSQAGYDVPRAAVAAVEAGADMVLFGSTLTSSDVALLAPDQVAATVSQIKAALEAAVGSGGLSASRLDDAVLQVVTAKHLDLCGRDQSS